MMRERHHGVGDRWIGGERIEGVAFALHDVVDVVAGEHAGRRGAIVLLTRLRPEPVYLVRLDGGGEGARVPQSALRSAS